MENEVLEAVQRFDLINKSSSQFKDWRIIRKALVEALKPSHNSDYAAALVEALKDWKNKVPSAICEAEINSLSAHLNAALQKRHCA